MTISEIMDSVGGLSAPSKMPCHGYSIPAARCKVGRKMRRVVGSICSICYALKGRYSFPNVSSALERRFALISQKGWAKNMVAALLRIEQSGYFRWHDSGDLQSIAHLRRIVRICEATPEIKHWLPTREFAVVRKFLESGGKIPANLTVRLSALMIDGLAPESLAKKLGVQVSGASASAFSCPAPKQGNVCGECRACWSKDNFNITYKVH